jgi:protein involved in polysaccharide export with SLBB domain
MGSFPISPESRRKWRMLLLIGLLACSLLVQSCQSTPDTVSKATTIGRTENASEASLQPSAYLLEVGDQIDIKLFYHPEMNETAMIRADGGISLQLVGEIPARGRTPEDLAKSLADRYTRVGLRNPSVTVMLRKSAGQRVYVGGEVNSPRMIPYEGRLTLAQALFEAGGLKATAETENLLVLRNDGHEKAVVMLVDFEKNVLGHGRDLPLQPSDVVVVPKSTIAKLNQFVEMYLSKMVPTWLSGQATFGYVKTLP